METLNLIVKRWNAETPKFFKNLFKFMASLTVVSTLLLPVKDDLPKPVQDVIGYAITVGAIGTVLSKLTIVDGALTPVEEKKEEEVLGV